MLTLFLSALVVGGTVLVIQLVLGAAAGVLDGHDVSPPHGLHASDGLQLFSVRALAAGAALFGAAGLMAALRGLPPLVSGAAALTAGAVGLVGTAAAMRAMLRLERDGAVRIEGAIGQPATVYLSIPGRRAGAGKVHLVLQGRTVEYQAVTAADALPTGASVLVVDAVGPDTVEVVPDPTLLTS